MTPITKTTKAKGQRRHTSRTCASCRNWAHFENGFGLCRSIHWLASGDFWQVGAGDTCVKWAAEVRRTPVALAPPPPLATRAARASERLETMEGPEAARRKAHGQKAGGKARHGQLAGNLPASSGDTRDVVGAGLDGARPEADPLEPEVAP